jgi:hypothetical protein
MAGTILNLASVILCSLSAKEEGKPAEKDGETENLRHLSRMDYSAEHLPLDCSLKNDE